MDPQQLSEQLSLQYMSELLEAIQLNGVPQIIQPPMVWDWGQKDYPMGSVPWQQVATLDVVPNDPVQNSADQGVAGTGFASNYDLFLSLLQPDPGKTDPKYVSLQQAITDAAHVLNTASGNSQVSYHNFVANTSSSETYTQWLANEGLAAGAAIDQAKQQLTEAQGAAKTYLASVTGPISDALTQYTKGLTGVLDQGGQLQQVAPWFTDHTPYDYVLSITGGQFGSDATHGSSKSFGIDQSTQRYSSKETWAEGGIAFLDWFGIEAGGSYDRIDTSSFKSEYSISFSFQDLGAIGVTPGHWYNPGVVSNYRNGPFVTGHSGYAHGTDVYYFGLGGALARVYTAIVVGYRPTVVLDAGDSFASYMHEKIEGEGVLWIGPFAFEASGGSETTKSSIEVDGSTITAKGMGDWPYIVALVSSWTAPPQ